MPHIHYITRSSVFLLQSAFFSSFSLLLLGVHACDTHAICEMLTRATFVGNPRTIERTMRLVYRFASDRDWIVAPHMRNRKDWWTERNAFT